MNTNMQLSVLQSDTQAEYISCSIPEKMVFDSSGSSASFLHPDDYTSTFDIKNRQRVRIEIPKDLLSQPVLEPLKGKFQLLQIWEGIVQEIRKDEFDSIIRDKTHPDNPDERVTIGREELSPDDLSLLQPGSVFYWSIGYADIPGRGRIRESRIRFRRLPGWTQKEIKRAENNAKWLAELFKFAESDSA